MIKVAQETDPVALMTMFVGFIRALYQIHQDAHWKVMGNNFYGNHLLFQRLYEAAQVSADEAAEKTIGLFGELPDTNKLIKEISDKFNPDNFDGNIITASLKAEQTFLALAETIYDRIKKLEAMTLGLDDLIMAIASRHEVHVYLLKRMLSDK